MAALGAAPEILPLAAARTPSYFSRRGFNPWAIAQLGERYNGIVEVTGSIPVGSTKWKKGLARTAEPFSHCSAGIWLPPEIAEQRVCGGNRSQFVA